MRPLLIISLVLLAGTACLAKSVRIVGGDVTSIEEYPSIVQVDARDILSGAWSHNCGGNIINSWYILSAAHCFLIPILNVNNRRIRAGTTYRNSGGSIHYVNRILNHPSFLQNGLDGDVSLLRLSTSLSLGPLIAQAPIPPAGTVLPDNLPVVHAGWGHTIEGVSSASPVLRDVQIYTINNIACRDVYLTLNPPGVVTENMICAGVPGGGRDACQGDSGGPLYYGEILVGVVSWGHGCGNETYPGVSAAVSSYTNWIIQNAV